MRRKFFEVRDDCTCIAVMALQMNANVSDIIEATFVAREGYPPHNPIRGASVIMMRLSNQVAHVDPYDWNDRTHRAAHEFIANNFDIIEDGAVVDVRTILDSNVKPAEAEIYIKKE